MERDLRRLTGSGSPSIRIGRFAWWDVRPSCGPVPRASAALAWGCLMGRERGGLGCRTRAWPASLRLLTARNTRHAVASWRSVSLALSRMLIHQANRVTGKSSSSSKGWLSWKDTMVVPVTTAPASPANAATVAAAARRLTTGPPTGRDLRPAARSTR
jgi:hypothetical protein